MELGIAFDVVLLPTTNTENENYRYTPNETFWVSLTQTNHIQPLNFNK